MQITVGELLTAGTLLAGLAGGYTALSFRVRALEQKIESIRKDQGTRIGTVEDRQAIVEGFTMGVRAARKKTKPIGEPIT